MTPAMKEARINATLRELASWSSSPAVMVRLAIYGCFQACEASGVYRTGD